MGIKSEWTDSGSDAVGRAELACKENRGFYAVIVSSQFSEFSGIAVVKAITKKLRDDSPVIIMSAYDWSEIELDARTAGVDSFLTKPVFKSGLIRLFRKLRDGKDEYSEKPALDKMPEINYSGRRVLLVEDNEINCEIATEILKMSKIEVETAENGKIAVDKFSDSKPGYYDIIFMDIQMPVMNGYDATLAIRSLKREDAPKIPIIAMTANVFAEDVREAKRHGMNEHLAKPFDLNKLSEILKAYLE